MKVVYRIFFKKERYMLSPQSLFSLNYAISIIGLMFFIIREIYNCYKDDTDKGFASKFDYEKTVRKYNLK